MRKKKESKRKTSLKRLKDLEIEVRKKEKMESTVALLRSNAGRLKRSTEVRRIYFP